MTETKKTEVKKPVTLLGALKKSREARRKALTKRVKPKKK